jgi:hypothetical protein
MSKFLFVLGVLCVLVAVPASACETCRTYFDYQTLTYCKYCEASYCGYFGCVVREAPWGDYCDSVWEADGADECFTDAGVSKSWCHPQYPSLNASTGAIPQSEWRLVRSRVENRGTKARPSRRSKG